jgi:hypothetical protein
MTNQTDWELINKDEIVEDACTARQLLIAAAMGAGLTFPQASELTLVGLSQYIIQSMIDRP